jgi:hypothetical protein
MPARRPNKGMSREVYRCWIELRDVSTGSVREIALQGVRRVHIPTRKQAERLPDQEILRLEDGAVVIEAQSLDELKIRLAEAYPDAQFERTLKCERDTAAEARREAAVHELAKIFARVAVERYLREAQGADVEGNTPIRD